ncbi:MAG: thioredoxin family protein, partial [Pyrinomonadaceae bacterium]
VIFILLCAACSFGQNTPTTAAIASKKVDTFPREKFDPLRDPKADVDQAVVKAKASGKRIMLDIGGEWCGWCIYMDKFIFQHPELAKILDENYVWVKVNMSEENENKAFLSAYPEITGYPHLFVLDEKGNLLESKDTSELEEEKGYNLVRFTEFLKTWSPKKEVENN